MDAKPLCSTKATSATECYFKALALIIADILVDAYAVAVEESIDL